MNATCASSTIGISGWNPEPGVRSTSRVMPSVDPDSRAATMRRSISSTPFSSMCVACITCSSVGP